MSFKKEFGLIVVGAIIFTASFLWKDLFADIEELYFPKKYGMMGRALFTILITIILLTIAIHLRTRFHLTTPQAPVGFDDSPLNNNPSENDITHDIGGDHGGLDVGGGDH